MGEGRQLDSIQILRGLAALAVLIYHATLRIPGLPHFDAGAAGVDLFFVISGFIMVYTSADLFGQRRAPGQFLARRCLRIIPLYWTLSAIVLVIHGFRPTNIASSFLFIPSHHDPILTAGWTLNYEMLFYAVFAVALLLPRRAAIAAICTILFAAVTIPAAIALDTPWRDWTAPLLLEFIFGILIGAAYYAGWRLPRGSIIALASAIAIIAVAEQTNLDRASIFGFARPLTWGVGGALIVVTALANNNAIRFLGRPFVLLGDASFALYLFHPLALSLIRPSAEPAHPVLYAVAFCVLAVAGSLLINRADNRVRQWLLKSPWQFLQTKRAVGRAMDEFAVPAPSSK
jgi:exopolysaccharide production protein ExoZ